MEQPASQGIRSIIACTLAGFAALAGAWMSARSAVSHSSPAQIAAYFDANVAPMLDDYADRDRAAADRAIAHLHTHFATFRAGVPLFAEDVTDWGTRFGVAGRTVKDLWTKLWNDPQQATAARDFVNTKFRAHIVSEEKLRRAVEDTVAVFREAVAANHNELLASVRLALQMPECPIRIPPIQIDRRLHDATIAAERISTSNAAGSIAVGLAGFVGGTVAYDAATRLVAALFARLAASTAAAAAIEGGAVAGGTATGGAAGTLAGPLGTVIGAGVGLAIGFIVDSWMTDSFKASLQKECGAYLDKLEHDLTTGSADAPGLRKLLTEAAAQNHAAFRAALIAEIETHNAMKRLLRILVLLLFITQPSAFATVASELAEALVRKFASQSAKEFAEAGGEVVVRNVITKAASEGGEAAARQAAGLCERFGPSVIRAIEGSPARIAQGLLKLPDDLIEAGIRAAAREPQVVGKLVSQFGDDALLVAAKHPGVGTGIVEKLGADGISPSKSMATPEVIRLARVADDIAAVAPAQRAAVVSKIQRTGARALDYLERHPKLLLTGAGVSVFLAAKDELLGTAEAPGIAERVWQRTLDALHNPLSLLFLAVSALLFTRVAFIIVRIMKFRRGRR